MRHFSTSFIMPFNFRNINFVDVQATLHKPMRYSVTSHHFIVADVTTGMVGILYLAYIIKEQEILYKI